jgi:hypothetical protein
MSRSTWRLPGRTSGRRWPPWATSAGEGAVAGHPQERQGRRLRVQRRCRPGRGVHPGARMRKPSGSHRSEVETSWPSLTGMNGAKHKKGNYDTGRAERSIL